LLNFTLINKGEVMSVYKNIISSFDDCSVQNYLNLLHENYVFIRHQSGQTVSKTEWAPIVTGMFDAMREEKLKFEENRCIYENEDILVMHSIGHFPDGTKEAIMAVHTLSNGKIVKTESGATRID